MAAAAGRAMVRVDTLQMSRFTPNEVLQELLNGNKRFITGTSAHPHQDFRRLQSLQEGQTPMCSVLGCADSRVPAEIIFDQGFGDMFTCRIAGNLATAEEIASLEYSVMALGVKLILVLGHTGCGAVKSALSGKAFPGFINSLVDHLAMAIARAQTRGANNFEDLQRMQEEMKRCRGHPDPAMIEAVTKENVLLQIDRIKRSTIIGDAVRAGKCKIAGAVYDLGSGQVDILVGK